MNFTPDPKKHLLLSFIKSIIRIIGYNCILFIPYNIAHIAGALLIFSEVLGIAEELV